MQNYEYLEVQFRNIYSMMTGLHTSPKILNRHQHPKTNTCVHQWTYIRYVYVYNYIKYTIVLKKFSVKNNVHFVHSKPHLTESCKSSVWFGMITYFWCFIGLRSLLGGLFIKLVPFATNLVCAAEIL